MTKRQLRRALVAMAGVVAALALAPPTALAEVDESAFGSGDADYTWFSFFANGAAGDTATGSFHLTYDGDVFISGVVRCLFVAGNRANAIGTITESNVEPPGAGVVGDEVDIMLQDNATPGSGFDLVGFFFGSPRGTCPGFLSDFSPDQTVESGEVVVVDVADPDGDNDGVLDTEDNCPGVPNPDQTNTDGDALGDACDPDDDNDGVSDKDDAFPTDPVEFSDNDGDGVGDKRDNCRGVTNPDQSDVDSDRSGDACDPVDNRDADADGVFDTADNCLGVGNADQRDTDVDGLGDACDPDDDNDTVPDASDNCVLVPNSSQGNLDHDALGDACDSTDDRTAVDQVADLIAQLQSSSAGPGGSYMAKLSAIGASIAAGDAAGACNKLNAFANEVRAQTGKKLTQSEADALLREDGSHQDEGRLRLAARHGTQGRNDEERTATVTRRACHRSLTRLAGACRWNGVGDGNGREHRRRGRNDQRVLSEGERTAARRCRRIRVSRQRTRHQVEREGPERQPRSAG